MAVENERGNPANPLKIAWLGAAPKVTHHVRQNCSTAKVDESINVCMDCVLIRVESVHRVCMTRAGIMFGFSLFHTSTIAHILTNQMSLFCHMTTITSEWGCL